MEHDLAKVGVAGSSPVSRSFLLQWKYPQIGRFHYFYIAGVRDMNNNRRLFLSGNALKIIAAVTMLIDHIGAAILLPMNLTGVNAGGQWIDVYGIFRTVGRTAFPIFVFLLVEGFFHTHSRERYFGRLLLFSLLSELPYDMAFYGKPVYENSQNVFWTLGIGFLVIWGLEGLYGRYAAGWKLVRKNGMGYGLSSWEGRGKAYYQASACFLAVILIFAGWLTAGILRTDYAGYGVLLIVVFYFGRHAKVWPVFTCLGGYLLFLWEPWCLFGFLLILFYDGTRKQSRKGFRYFFYLFYPVHLLIFGIIRVVFLVN